MSEHPGSPILHHNGKGLFGGYASHWYRQLGPQSGRCVICPTYLLPARKSGSADVRSPSHSCSLPGRSWPSHRRIQHLNPPTRDRATTPSPRRQYGPTTPRPHPRWTTPPTASGTTLWRSWGWCRVMSPYPVGPPWRSGRCTLTATYTSVFCGTTWWRTRTSRVGCTTRTTGPSPPHGRTDWVSTFR